VSLLGSSWDEFRDWPIPHSDVIDGHEGLLQAVAELREDLDPALSTRNNILKWLRELQCSDAPKGAHLQADLLLLALINDPEIMEAFVSIEKWYE